MAAVFRVVTGAVMAPASPSGPYKPQSVLGFSQRVTSFLYLQPRFWTNRRRAGDYHVFPDWFFCKSWISLNGERRFNEPRWCFGRLGHIEKPKSAKLARAPALRHSIHSLPEAPRVLEPRPCRRAGRWSPPRAPRVQGSSVAPARPRPMGPGLNTARATGRRSTAARTRRRVEGVESH